jgi:hypothetical protein
MVASDEVIRESESVRPDRIGYRIWIAVLLFLNFGAGGNIPWGKVPSTPSVAISSKAGQPAANEAEKQAEIMQKELAEAARVEEEKPRPDVRRFAMIQERMSKPLRLETVEFANSTADGTALAAPTNVFDISKLLFVSWRVVFENRLYGIDTNQYRVDAVYVNPDGSTLGSVDDIQIVRKNQQRAVFSGRVGNSAGSAILPGQYTVKFYLNGRYMAQKQFQVTAIPWFPPRMP